MSCSRSTALHVAWVLSLCVGPSAHAQDSADALGFGDAPIATAAAPSEASATEPADTSAPGAPSDIHLSGSTSVQGALRLEREGEDRFGKLRLVFAPRLEYRHDFKRSTSFALVASGRAEADFAYLLRPEAYDAPTMEVYGSQLIIGETYLRLSTSHLELAFGEQIVNFGQGEVLTLLDVVNPRDLREPLFADLEELRLPLLMTRVGLSLGRFAADLRIVHEAYFGLLAPPLGEFSPLRKLFMDIPGAAPFLSERELRYEHLPGRDLSDFGATQLHLRLSLRVARADLSLQASSVLDGFGVPVVPAPEQWLETRVDLPTYHSRYGLVGQAGALSVGAFLLRWELACEILRPFVTRTRQSALPNLSSERLYALRGLLGVTFVPTARTNVALELLQGYVIDNPERRPGSVNELLLPVEATQIALRLSQTFLRDRGTLTLVALCIGLSEFNAFAGRAELSYLLTDDLRAALGAVTYQPSAHFGPFYGFERNDRVYLNLRFSFTTH
jgi:hypothetical protein